jgi:hypothetical protein
MAVWRQYDGQHMQLRSRLYSPGSGWGMAETIDTGDTPAPAEGLVIDRDGNAIVVWEESGSAPCPEESSCARYNLFVNRYTPGDGWGDRKLVASAVAGRSMAARVAMTPGGEAMLVWAQDDGKRSNIWARRYTRDGGWRSSARIESEAGSAYDAQVAMDANANAIAVWSQRNGPQQETRTNRYIAGEGWGTAARIDSDSAGNGMFARIVMNARGDAITTWQQIHASGSRIWSNSFSITGGWSAPTLAVSSAGGVQHANLGMDAGGNGVLVWDELYPPTPGIFRINVWGNRWLAGVGWLTAVLIDTAETADAPMLAVDASGNAIAAWSRREGGRSRARTSRYVANAGWSAATFLDSDGAGDTTLTGLTVDGSGDAIATWHQFEGPSFGAPLDAFYRRFE